MPISKENRARYPKEWAAISMRIRDERARWRCECGGECGAHEERCSAKNGSAHPITGSCVVLTVAHLDHTPENCDDDNLRAMCQRCHNRYDQAHRKANARKTRHRGQATLWSEGDSDG